MPVRRTAAAPGMATAAACAAPPPVPVSTAMHDFPAHDGAP
jgi:hypothetical protein